MSVYLHVGQCGNQLGDAFWRLAPDASDAPDGAQGSASSQAKHVAVTKSERPAQPPRRGAAWPALYGDMFFHRRSRRARCILVDTEPKVIRSVLRSGRWPFEPAHVHHEQSGRGNNWAMGYNLQTHQRNVLPSKSDLHSLVASTATSSRTKKKLLSAVGVDGAADKHELVELVMESLRQEIEKLDVYRGAVLMHSLGGGTGAGLGCRLLETIRDVYPRSHLAAVSVAPSCSSGDTPLQNYNALFTLQHLQEHTDCVIYKENDELLKSVLYWKGLVSQAGGGAAPSPREGDDKKATLREMNAMAAADVAGLVFPTVQKAETRAGGFRDVAAQPFDMAKLIHDCCPLPTTKFLDVRTGLLRDSMAQPKKSSNSAASTIDPLFHAVPAVHNGGGGDDDAIMSKLGRQTVQSFPRWTSASRAIGGRVLVRHASVGTGPGASKSLDESLTGSLPRMHLGNSVEAAYSSFAPFHCLGGKASVTVALDYGHATTSINHFLNRGRKQFEANAYTHWYKQYGLEDVDFEHAFEQCTQIVRNYDEMLRP